MRNEKNLTRNDAIAEEAAEWFVALQDPDQQTRTEFAVWLRASPENIREFMAVTALWDTLPELTSQPSADELISNVSSMQNIVELSAAGPMPRVAANAPQSRRKWLGFAAAASIVGLSLSIVWSELNPPADPNFHSTMVGEMSSLALPDGSVVTLNTQTSVRVAYSETHRDIHLITGEALFDVTKDAVRPFRVFTEHGVVRAVGTQFNVHSRATEMTVTVVEGEVDVQANSNLTRAGNSLTNQGGSSVSVAPEPVRLIVGQQARVSAEVAVSEAVTAKAIAWQERRLIFEALPLKDVINEFNRYNDRPILIADPALEVLPITAIFQSNDPESFVDFLSQMRHADSRRRSDGVLVLYAVDGD